MLYGLYMVFFVNLLLILCIFCLVCFYNPLKILRKNLSLGHSKKRTDPIPKGGKRMDSYSVKKSRILQRDDESLPLKIKEIKW